MTSTVSTENLYGNFIQECESKLAQLADCKKLRLYKEFKNEFCLESYLLTVPSVTYTQCVARLRLSSHNLNIELGRHAKPKISVPDRLCVRCDSGVVDDEIHFLIQCPAFARVRDELFRKISLNIPDFQKMDSYAKFISIMSSKCSEINLQLGKFLYKCLPQ